MSVNESVYSNTINISDLFDRIDQVTTNYGNEKVKLAQAMCRDDSVDELGHEREARGYTGIFSMQTLTGLPVFGKTGMIAFYHHIPDEGVGVIIYAPHVGVDSRGEWGNLNRPGINRLSKSCGANHRILEHFKEGTIFPIGGETELSEVALKLESYKPRILESEVPIKEIMEVEYELGMQILEGMIIDIQNLEKHSFPIFVFGGINIDTCYDQFNNFQLRKIMLYKEGIGKEL